MLDNSIPLQIGALSSTATTAVSLNDIRSGQSVRSYKISETDRLSLVIGNQVTKENVPVGANRSRISLERTKVLSDGSERKVIASMVISTPRDSTFTSSEVDGVIRGLIGFLSGIPVNTATDEVDGWHTSSTHGLDGSVLVTRVRNGEE
jgi:hypothetical protein